MSLNFTFVKAGCKTGKTFSLKEDGSLEKDDKNGLSIGSFHVIKCETIKDVEELIVKSSTNKNLLILGTPKHTNGVIFCKETEDNASDLGKEKIERNLKNFRYRQNEGLLLIDYDNDKEFSQYGELSKEELLNIIYEVAPEIETAPHMWKTSSSSNIYQVKDKDGNKTFEEKAGIKGQHIFVHVKDASKIEFYAEELFKRFWLAGYGHISISKSGSMLERSVMDAAVNSPERLVFLKSNVLENEHGKLDQSIDIETFNHDSEPLDIEKIEHLSHEKKIESDKAIEKAKEIISPEALVNRKNFVKKNALKLGLSEKDLDYSVISRRLFNDFKIKMWSGVEVTVGEILRNKEKFDNSYCYEPMERDYGNGSQAFIDCYNGIIFSHAHGGIVYTIADETKKTPEDLGHMLSSITDESEKYKKAAKFAVDYKYLDVQMEKLYQIMALDGKVKASSVKKTMRNFLNDEVKKRNAESKSLKSILPDYLREPIELDFPDLKISSTGIVSKMNSIDNFTFVLENYGLIVKYDKILKEIEVTFPDGFLEDQSDLKNNSTEEVIKHLLEINDMNVKNNIDKINIVANYHQINRPLDWIWAVPWDGVDRLSQLLDRVKENIDISEDEDVNNKFCDKYKRKVIESWLVQAMAALDFCKNTPLENAKPKYEFILDIIAGQGVNKTDFFRSLLPEELQRYLKTGIVLDVNKTDSIRKATTCWIAEFGEIDGTLELTSPAMLKGFMSETVDEYRMPYAPKMEKYKRNTVFIGTVNVGHHLVDSTGNRRFFPLQVKNMIPLNYNGIVKGEEFEEINVQQLWAQVWDMYIGGYQWWPDKEENSEFDNMLNFMSKKHTKVSSIEAIVDDFIDTDKNDEWRKKHKKVRGSDLYKGYKDEGDKVVQFSIKAEFKYLNKLELMGYLKLENNDVNLQEFMDVMSHKGFSDNVKKVDGKARRCYAVCFKDGKTPISVNIGGNKFNG